ncbi:hypothetical protein BpHYR1_007869 [Brachionus plicatilis]|uniref:Uncharacterized protein n=1 Tax=Brachionus plicatilis TaxID=10195 RepID=A0A3M7QDX9_BRAPC|nr:hypothetical protein BpHYR1_007869 [Brachionus plicatilis]
MNLTTPKRSKDSKNCLLTYKNYSWRCNSCTTQVNYDLHKNFYQYLLHLDQPHESRLTSRNLEETTLLVSNMLNKTIVYLRTYLYLY